MLLIILIVLSVALIYITTSRYRVHPFLAILFVAFGNDYIEQLRPWKEMSDKGLTTWESWSIFPPPCPIPTALSGSSTIINRKWNLRLLLNCPPEPQARSGRAVKAGCFHRANKT